MGHAVLYKISIAGELPTILGQSLSPTAEAPTGIRVLIYLLTPPCIHDATVSHLLGASHCILGRHAKTKSSFFGIIFHRVPSKYHVAATYIPICPNSHAPITDPGAPTHGTSHGHAIALYRSNSSGAKRHA
jgi:hypothetical protein